MLNIEKRYIVDENNKRLAVEVDYDVLTRLEEILEDHALYHLMQETEESESLSLPEAQKYYRELMSK